MIKQLLEKQSVFSTTLRAFAFFAQRSFFDRFTRLLTDGSAKLNLALNKPNRSNTVEELAKTWQKLMPPDGQHLFPIKEVDSKTAHVEIHLHCPLRGSGNVEACYKLMNYDRQLMSAVDGQLIVLASQSNSGKDHCKLAIRKKGEDVADLIPAHRNKKGASE